MRLVRLAALAAFLAGSPAWAQETALPLRPGEALLEIHAEGIHRSRPDVMTISVGVVTTGRTAAEALAANSENADRVIARVRSLGVAPSDIQTRDLRVRPQFAEDRGRDEERRIVGYVAANRVSLRLRDLMRAGAIIGAAFEAGANDVDGPHFSLANGRPAMLAAQRDAIRLAREEAENHAAALDLRVVRVLRVSERSAGPSRDRSNAIVVSGRSLASVPIEPGEIETAANVWMDFALAPR